VIASEVLGRATPAVVENPELALGRVTIMPGAAIPVHYHAGTQIGVVVQGELTYSVFSGDIAWYKVDDPAAPPITVAAGETIVMRAGDAVIESPGAVHQGRNEGDVPLIIYLSTLFPAGAPRAIIVAATPSP
jgi:quercetin dioxygenase-like cupin family protein